MTRRKRGASIQRVIFCGTVFVGKYCSRYSVDLYKRGDGLCLTVANHAPASWALPSRRCGSWSKPPLGRSPRREYTTTVRAGTRHVVSYIRDSNSPRRITGHVRIPRARTVHGKRVGARAGTYSERT